MSKLLRGIAAGWGGQETRRRVFHDDRGVHPAVVAARAFFDLPVAEESTRPTDNHRDHGGSMRDVRLGLPRDSELDSTDFLKVLLVLAVGALLYFGIQAHY